MRVRSSGTDGSRSGQSFGACQARWSQDHLSLARPAAASQGASNLLQRLARAAGRNRSSCMQTAGLQACAMSMKQCSGLTWLENTRMTCWARRWRSSGVTAERSAAEDEAMGYSPPTPKPYLQGVRVLITKCQVHTFQGLQRSDQTDSRDSNSGCSLQHASINQAGSAAAPRPAPGARVTTAQLKRPWPWLTAHHV